ncbi:MAG TPA: translocation/assembly module TamB domain-containing protein, partial [Janthinobacterium sp.]|nr:translocation/assembly module TamB domain-containing protein [Janthinobacterium sp.]
PPHAPAPAPAPAPRRRRWLRRTLAGVAALAVLLGGAFWLLGRESTLQALAQKAARASGGEIAVSGVSGSLYGAMHVGHLVYRGSDSVVTADDIDISWSPLQYFSEGVVIQRLHIASLASHSTGPSKAPTLPAALAPPFQLSVADARLERLTLSSSGSGGSGGNTVIEKIRLSLSGDKSGWRLRDASAVTPFGLAAAEASIAGQRPFALDGKASLTQMSAPAGHKAAQLLAQLHGNLSLLDIKASAASDQASGEAVLTLAPFDPVILRSASIQGRGIDPSRFNRAWPKASLELRAALDIAAGQRVSGKLAVSNQGTAGPLDHQLLPLRGISAQLGGTLTATSVDAVLIDLAAAGKFSGSGTVRRSAPDAGVGIASFRLHTDRIDLKAIQSSMKATRIAGDVSLSSSEGRDAAHSTQTFSALLAQDGLRLDFQATLADALLRIQHARLQAGKGSVSVSGQANLKEGQAFKAGVSAEHFNPAAFGDYPAADLNADVRLDGHIAPAWQVAADFALRPSRLFGQALSGAGKLTADAKHVSGVQAKLALGQNSVDLRGSLGAPGEKLAWRVDARQLSALRSDLAGALGASGIVSGTMAAPRSSFEADARGVGILAATGAKAGAKTPAADSLLHVSGELALAGPQHHVELKAAGSAQRLNPAAFGAYPSGSISADFSADFSGGARLAGGWQAGLDLRLRPSTLSNAPLSGYAKFKASASRVENADVDLRLGPNAIQAKGAFGAPRDRLDWKIDAPQLAGIGPQFAGVLRGSGSLSGTAAAPALVAALNAGELRLFGQYQVKALRASASLSAGNGGDYAFVSDIEASGFTSPGLSLATARLQTGGTRAVHTLQLSARNDDFDAAASVKGGWNAGAWNGTLETLQNHGRYAFTLQAPVPVHLAGPVGSGVEGLLHPQQIAASNATLQLPGGSISLQSLEKTGPNWRSTGQAAGVPLNYLAQALPAWRDNASSDLTLGAQWSLNLQAAAGADPAIAGMLHAYREKGDITVGSDQPLALGLRTLDARMDVAAGALRLNVELDGARAGQLRLAAGAQLRQGRIANDSPLTLSGSADMASLAWLAPLTGQQGLELDGALRLAISGAGTIGAPALNGDITGNKLMVNWADQGLKLRNGRLQAKLAGDQLQLQRLAFDGDQGTLQMDGWVRFANAEPTMQLKLVADKLQALSRPDRTLVLSGQSTLVRDQKRFQLDGKFKADRALIELAAQDTPTLSDDVVVLGKAGNGAGADARPAAPGMPLNIDLEADLGDAFQLRAKGLDAQLAGSAHIRIQERRPPRINGSIRVVSGTYAAYGQKLSIERGLLNFTGAYDNPGLNILAVRKRPEGETLTETNVEAGVEVRGTALAPTARLVSTPAVPDSEKLAWLVLGHGSDGTGSDEMGLLTTAAGALFGGSGGGLQSRLANSLGLDEVGLGQSSSATNTTAAANGTQATGLESTVVTVGKRLSQRAYLSFEQGTSTASSLVKLRYKLNTRITLQFQTGVNSGFDLLYNWAFD